MAWIISIGKALFFATASALFVFVVAMVPLPGDNSKATGLTLLLRTRGELLVLSGFFQIVLGLILLRIDVFIDCGRLHFTLLR